MHTSSHDPAFADAILETVGLPLLALDADLKVEVANEAFLRHFQVTRRETVGRLVYELGNGQWNIPKLRALLEDILKRESFIEDYLVEHAFEHIGPRCMRLNAKRIHRSNAKDSILLAIVDETERETLRAELVGRIEFADKLIDSVREGLLILHSDLCVHSANQPFYEMFKVHPLETVGRSVSKLGNGQWAIPDLRRLLEDLLPREKHFDDYKVQHDFEGLGHRVMLLNGRRLDHIDLIILAIRDVTALHEEESARVRAEAALRKSEKRLRRVLETDAVGVLFFDADGTLTGANNAFLKMTGYSREEVESRSLNWRTMTPPEHVAVSEEQLAHYALTGRIGPYEKEYFRKDGGRLWMLFTGRELDEGTLVEFVIDIGHRKRAEARQKMLLREVNHRSKNMLALVQAIARQTCSAGPQDFLDRFGERIRALAASQDLLVKSDWQGVSLGDLVNSQLAHLADAIGARIEIEGPQLLITASAAQSLGMALHELATNAGQHGALSNNSGRVKVSWGLERASEEIFSMSWIESGGPAVAPPARRGFGWIVIVTLVETGLRAKAGLWFPAEGVTWRVSCPASSVLERNNGREGAKR